jgi:3-methylcrotonyl-CoA carboxylase alpha subunit
VREGDEITPYYDPMIAKVIVHGASRDQALARMRAALADTLIAGTITNKAFLSALCAHEGFAAGEVDTGLIERDLDKLVGQPEPPLLAKAVAALAVLGLTGASGQADAWGSLTGFRLWGAAQNFLTLTCGDEAHEVRVSIRNAHDFKVATGGDAVDIHLVPGAPDRMIVDGHAQPMRFAVSRHGGRVCGVTVFLDGESFVFGVPDSVGDAADAGSGDDVRAPMPGLVKQVRVSVGHAVCKGDALAVLEAMKMEHTLAAPRDGVVAAVNAGEGDQVQDGDLLVSLESERE